MNTNTNPRRIFKPSLGLAMLAFCCMTSPAQAETDCVKGEIEGWVTLQTVMGPGVGYFIMTLGDQAIPITTVGTFVPPMKVTEDGTIHLTVQENDTAPDGSTVQFLDNLVLSPTDIPGEYRLRIKSSYVSGTGIFNGPDLDGRYIGHGEVSFNDLTMHHSGQVTVCGFGV